MPANQEIPPWMGQQPPPGGQPPPAPAWPGPPPPPAGRPSGLLTFVAVMNLVFSVACGCLSGSWAQAWNTVHTNPDAIVNEMKTGMEWSIENSRERGQSDTPVERVMTDAFSDPAKVRQIVVDVSENPATGAVRTASMVAGIAQVVLLVGSIMLLMRKNAGRLLSMLALLAFIGGTIATIVKFPPVATTIGESISSNVVESSGYKDLGAAERSKVDSIADSFPEILQITVLVVSVIMMIWPAIALLILLFSRSIREACARP
jgi:hypothetical protein